ncbi:MAG: 1-(5-phosphoribosyl)-5-[(5-phosphoribosylamino)methylideneamino]imidazole-4-carboxamide isomerase [Alphaproteobacteria bacterium]
MILYPAIDLKDGTCVRLKRGEMNEAIVFNKDPVAQAERFAGLGFQRLHVIDLNGAFAGKGVNGVSIRAILEATKLPIQLGGGIRNRQMAEQWLEGGVSRVILGTMAVTNPGLVKELARDFPGKIAVGLDARKGFVAVEGWANQTEISAVDLGREFEDSGVCAVVYTDIERDGMREGVNLEATAALARALEIPVIASGGVSSLDDIAALKALKGEGVGGAILGRALYDGTIDSKAALALAGS